jgi:uncharacterized protein (DUF927 family)
MYRAPLAHALFPDVTPWVEGPTGVLKSTLLALGMNHFGPFTRLTLPSWTGTGNALERLAFTAKDVPLPLDDFIPEGTRAREMEAVAQRVIRAQGNQSGRARLTDATTSRPTY